MNGCKPLKVHMCTAFLNKLTSEKSITKIATKHDVSSNFANVELLLTKFIKNTKVACHEFSISELVLASMSLGVHGLEPLSSPAPVGQSAGIWRVVAGKMYERILDLSI